VGRAELQRVIEEGLELDLGVAQHIGIRRAAGRVLAQELGEHAVLVLGGEVHGLEFDPDHVRGRGRVDQVLPRRAVLVIVVVLPVLHEETDDLMALLFQQMRRDRRIDAARHADDDTGTHARSTEGCACTMSSGKRRPVR
jgi:hypothetical protein